MNEYCECCLIIIHILEKMVKVKAFDGFTFKPQLYAQILHKNMEYIEDCQVLQTFNTHEFISKGLIQAENNQFIYLYEQQFLGFNTLGLLAQLSLTDYIQKKIKKHEKTLVRPHLNQNTYVKDHVGPVIVGHQLHQDIEAILLELKQVNQPFAAWDTIDGRKHKLWRISSFQHLLSHFEKIQNFYILDGHHRFEAAASYLEKQGQEVQQKNKWIQGLIYSTKYIRTYPQFRKLIHQDNRNIIRSLMSNQKLIVEEISQYQPLDDSLEIVLLQDQRFFTIKRIQDVGMACLKTGVQKLDQILKQAFEQIDKKVNNPIKYIPSIMFKFDDLSKHKEPIFLVKGPCIKTIFDVANQGQFLPPKSTWLEPKPCLHMVIRVPY